MSNVNTSAVIVLNEAGQALLLRRGKTAPWEPGKWSLPGGVIDPGETPEQAAIRETYEEVGIRINQIKKLEVIDSGEGWAVAFFICKDWSGTPELKETHGVLENDQMAWADKNDLKRYRFVPTVDEALTNYFEGTKMKFTKDYVKQVIKEHLSLYLEGQAEDLTEEFPELQPAYDAGIRNPQYLRWIQKRRAGEPVEDVAGVVKRFDAVKGRLKAAGKSPDIYSYKTAALLRQAIEDLGASKTSEIKRVKREELTYFGTYGDWAVFMPHTTQASIQLGKGTTWCTAATGTANRFLPYCAEPDSTTILYYIIKKGADSRTDPTAKLCIGYKKGKRVIPSKNGGLSVTAYNNGLTMDKLSNILGDQLEPILNVIEESARSIGTNHPAKEVMRNAAKDPVTFQRALAGLNEERKLEQMNFIVKHYGSFISQEVVRFLLSYGHNSTKISVAGSPSTSLDLLVQLASDEDHYVRKEVARNPSTPLEVLKNLANDEDDGVRMNVGKNPSLPLELMLKLAEDPSRKARAGVAGNPSTPPELLLKLVEDEASFVRYDAIRNPSLPTEALAKVAFLLMKETDGLSHMDNMTLTSITSNPSTPPEVLSQLYLGPNLAGHSWWFPEYKSDILLNPSTPIDLLHAILDKERKRRHPDQHVVEKIAARPDLPPEILGKLANSRVTGAMKKAANNRSTPPKALLKLSKSEDFYVKSAVSRNRYTPPEALTLLAAESGEKNSWKIRKYVAKNRSTPINVLLKLANDENEQVRAEVAKNTTYKKRKLNEMNLKNTYFEGTKMKFTEAYIKQAIREELEAVLDEKKKKACKPAKGKRFAKRVNGKCRSFGQAGQAKGGGDRIRPGTKKGDAYCARSAKIKKCKNPPCANDLSRKKWKCRGSKSMK